MLSAKFGGIRKLMWNTLHVLSSVDSIIALRIYVDNRFLNVIASSNREQQTRTQRCARFRLDVSSFQEPLDWTHCSCTFVYCIPSIRLFSKCAVASLSLWECVFPWKGVCGVVRIAASAKIGPDQHIYSRSLDTSEQSRVRKRAAKYLNVWWQSLPSQYLW